MLKISLLHATFMSDADPLTHRDRWLELAASPSRVDYVVAMNLDDSRAVACTTGATRAVTTPRDTYSTAVQNWNAAAEIATGDLLVVISDDLFPSANWDEALELLVGQYDPRVTDFAIKIQDSPNSADMTLRHPVVSRRFYTRFGLFDPNFRGVFCDNDITMRAYLFSRILDGRSLVVPHAHPHFDHDVHETISQKKINATEEYDYGREVFKKKFFPATFGLTLNRLTLPTPSARHFLGRGLRRWALAVLKPSTLRVPPVSHR